MIYGTGTCTGADVCTESVGTAARHRPTEVVGDCAGGCIGSAVRRGWVNVGCIFEKKEERHTAAPIDAQVAHATLKLSRSAALLVALFAALLAALLLVRLELGLQLGLRPSSTCVRRVQISSAKGLDEERARQKCQIYLLRMRPKAIFLEFLSGIPAGC